MNYLNLEYKNNILKKKKQYIIIKIEKLGFLNKKLYLYKKID